MDEIIKETLRYLGYGNNLPDEPSMTLITNVITELKTYAAYKSLVQEFPVQLLKENLIDVSSFQVTSKHLSENLLGCESVLLFAATLGAKVDLLIGRYTKLQMSRAVVFQAAAAALIEAYCDIQNKTLREYYLQKEYYLRPRFSPGYGDFSIEHQRDFIRVLDTPKKIGLTLTDSLVMAPSKSVTAVIGISKHKTTCQIKGCEACQKEGCVYRRE